MFNNKICKRCGKKISKSYDFCPYCGISFNGLDKSDWGMLGKNDFTPISTEIKLPAGVDMLFNSLIKGFDKQFRELDKEIGKIDNKKLIEPKRGAKSGGISISISSFGNEPPKINVKSFGNTPEFREEQTTKTRLNNRAQQIQLSEQNLKRLSTLPRTEPATNIRRLSNKIVYEIEMPGVKSEKDISIIQLENSIEIKALGKDKAYFKLIPISLPIINHKLSNGKLILELEAED
ncbi:MAG: zinc-ribbon domain-containing protein [Nanoarchaeota archaeon]|nr:zinc-ribbon domain-containing protein [Nanoarchaeota archaeon]